MSSPPSTDCSASIECGGSLRFRSWESVGAWDAVWSHESDRWDCGHSTTKRNKKAATGGPFNLALLARCYCCAVSPTPDNLDVDQDVACSATVSS